MASIKRIDSYSDNRFSDTVLNQHGAYLMDGEPYEIEIMDSFTAEIRGKDANLFEELIEEFRFHAPHICTFFDKDGRVVARYSPAQLFEIPIDNIQPSQFFVDEEKLRAVRTFVHGEEDIIVQVIPYGERFIVLDGHTRLFLATQIGFDKVKAVMSETEDWVWQFVHEAERRKILCPKDMKLLPHEQYEIQWNRYCDEVFAKEE